MAEVLSPFTTPNNPVTLRQLRIAASEPYQPVSSTQPNQQSSLIMSAPRSHYNSGATGYRGTSAAPISPYAFKTTPQLRSHQASANAPQPLASGNPSVGNRQRYPAPSSISTTSSTASSNFSGGSPQYTMKEDSSLKSTFQIPPLIAQGDLMADFNLASLDASTGPDLPAKPSPDRYRRTQLRSDPNVHTLRTMPPGTIANLAASQAFSTAKVGQFYQAPQQVNLASPRNSSVSTGIEPLAVQSHAENTRPMEGEEQQTRHYASDTAKRYRQRNSGGGGSQDYATIKLVPGAPAPSRVAAASVVDEQSQTSSRTTRPSFSTQDSRPSLHHRTSSSVSQNERSQQQIKPTSPVDVSRRANPSPLSKPPTANGPPTSPTKSFGERQSFQSPAVAAMTAINDKDKGMKSRLRRAFSFGSTAELRRASTIETDPALDRARMKREQFSHGLNDEQDAVAQKQAAGGLGENIYSGQGMFTGSTDNLSISSTASSASMMLRKMGQGMRKGSRSIKGIFRPKSVVGVPSADAASVGQVTMLNVEAERELLNVNPNPHDHPGGGTGMPKLEKNSIDAAAISPLAPIALPVQTDGEGDGPRRNIVGGDQERAEVLASVRRGILKRSVTASPMSSPTMRPTDSTLPYRSVSGFDASASPGPASPRRTGHRRTDSSSRDSDDYFTNPPRPGAAQSTRSLPGTPRGLGRNISFSPRIQCHETWASGEYDRRGDVATCNRLTPMLAQQIKEELNTFKMEMEVHELSKPHTHFF